MQCSVRTLWAWRKLVQARQLHLSFQCLRGMFLCDALFGARCHSVEPALVWRAIPQCLHVKHLTEMFSAIMKSFAHVSATALCEQAKPCLYCKPTWTRHCIPTNSHVHFQPVSKKATQTCQGADLIKLTNFGPETRSSSLRRADRAQKQRHRSQPGQHKRRNASKCCPLRKIGTADTE